MTVHSFPAEPPGQRSGEGREPHGSVGDHITDAAERLYDAIGWDTTTCARMASLGYDVSDYLAVRDLPVWTR